MYTDFDRRRAWVSSSRANYTTKNGIWFFSAVLTVTPSGNHRVTLEIFKRNKEGDFTFQEKIIYLRGASYARQDFLNSAPTYILHIGEGLQQLLIAKHIRLSFRGGDSN